MSTRSMAARRRRAADRRKKRDTPAPRPAKLIPGPAPNPAPAPTSTSTAAAPIPGAGSGVAAREPELEAAGVGARSGTSHPSMPPLDHPAADDLRHSQQRRLPPLAAAGAGLDAPPDVEPELPPDLSERAVAVRRYRAASGDSQPPSEPPRPPRPPRPPLWQRPRDGFTWRERDWRSIVWVRPLRRLPTVLVSLVLLAVVLGGTFILVSRAVGHTPLQVHLTSPFSSNATPTPRTQPVIVQPNSTGATPTPAFPQYTIGAWPADPSPPGAGSDQLFARVSDNLMPIKGIVVTFSIILPNGYVTAGPLTTDAHGLVSYTLVYSSPANQPIQVTVTANTPRGAISATTYIVPV